MAKTKQKVPKEYELDILKVRDVMKRLNLKKMDNESLEKIAAELKFAVKNDKARTSHLRGKMLASLRFLNK